MLYDRWRQIAREFSRELALRDFASGQTWTFAQLAAETEAGRSRGDETQISFPQGNSADFILTVLRAWQANQIICPLEPGQPPPDIGRARHSVRAVPVVGGRRAKDCPPYLLGFTPPIAHLKTTSATSGPPRLVAFTAEQIAADAENVVATMSLRRDWPNLGVISLAHSYGFSNLVTPLLLHGIPLILAPAPLPETVRQAAALAPHITLPAVPAMWRAWHDAKAIPANVRLAISAGAPLPLVLEQAVFESCGLKIHNFYGASECGGIAYDTSETPRTAAACAGTPMKNVSLLVADDGCLEVRSRAVAEGYLADGRWEMEVGEGISPICHLPSAISSFHTTDLAEISGGLVYLRGRVGDQINVAGRKVSPETIERALLKHPQVLECLVFGVPSPDTRVGERNEEIVAVIVCARASSPSPRSEARGEGQQYKVSSGLVEQTASSPRPSPPREEREFSLRARESTLRQFILETLPAWQTPRHWLFVGALQTNPRGKVSRVDWRRQFMSRSK